MRLASVLPNPRKFNPLGDHKYVINRSGLIYNIMVKRGIVVPEFNETQADKETVGLSASSVSIEETKPSSQ